MQLSDGEKIIFKDHPSWRSAIAFYLKGLIVVAIVGGIMALIGKISGDKKIDWALVVGVAVAAFVIVMVVGWIRRLVTVYMVTNQRIYIRRGLISRTEQETRLQRVQNVNTSQSVLQRMLAVGNVKFDTAGGEHYDFAFRGVAAPQRVVQAVHQAQSEARAAGGASPQQSPPPLDPEEGL